MFIIHKAVTAKEGKLALLSLCLSVREVLCICGAEKLAPQAESVEAARKWVEGGREKCSVLSAQFKA